MFGQSRFGDHGMATSVQQHLYQCDQCGAPEIVAAPILYQQGTRTFSGIFNHGISQSVSAQALAPPRPRGYARKLLPFALMVTLFAIGACFDLDAFVQRATLSVTEIEVAMIFLSLLGASIWLAVHSFRKISRYNREVYPKLQSEWTHTYMCQRCGKLSLIP